MDTIQTSLYIGAVVGLTELTKFSKYVPDRHGLLVCAILSFGAVLLHILQHGYQQALLTTYFFGWTNILFASAGVYGFIREVRPGDTVSANRAIAPLLVIALFTAGCAGSDRPNLTPVQVAAETASYATDAVQLVDTSVKSVTAFAIAQGGRTEETDTVISAIENNVMPRAKELARVLRLMTAATTPDLQNATKEEIKVALDAYEKVVEETLGQGRIPAGMTSALSTSVTGIRDLIKNIRVTFRFSEV